MVDAVTASARTALLWLSSAHVAQNSAQATTQQMTHQLHAAQQPA